MSYAILYPIVGIVCFALGAWLSWPKEEEV